MAVFFSRLFIAALSLGAAGAAVLAHPGHGPAVVEGHSHVLEWAVVLAASIILLVVVRRAFYRR